MEMAEDDGDSVYSEVYEEEPRTEAFFDCDMIADSEESEEEMWDESEPDDFDKDPNYDHTAEERQLEEEQLADRRRMEIDALITGPLVEEEVTAIPPADCKPRKTASGTGHIKKRPQKRCPLPHCSAQVIRMTDHLVTRHNVPRPEAREWFKQDGARETKMPRSKCNICGTLQTNMGQHLSRKHGHAQKTKSASKGTGSRKPSEGGCNIPTWIPKSVLNRDLWAQFLTWLVEDKRMAELEANRTAKQVLNWFQAVDVKVNVHRLFRKATSDSDYIAKTYFDINILPLVREVEVDNRRGSNVVNKVNRVKKWCEFMADSKHFFLENGGGSLDAVSRFSKKLTDWNHRIFGKAKKTRDSVIRHQTQDRSDIYNEIRKRNTTLQRKCHDEQNPTKLRDAFIATLLGINIARAGEVMNLTSQEVFAGTEVDQHWVLMRVHQHKTLIEHGPASLYLQRKTHVRLVKFVKAHGKQWAFVTDSGRKVGNSQMAKIMAANLGVTPSKWRKLFAHHNRHKTEQFRESVISKMNHTGDTHRRWYEGVAAKDTYLEVVKVAAGQGHGISAAEAPKEKELMRIRGELESYPEPSDTDEEDEDQPCAPGSCSDPASASASASASAEASASASASATSPCAATPAAPKFINLPPPLTKAELPEELKVIGFMLPTRHFMKKDYPHNKNSPWASPRLLPWLHYYLGGYRGNKNVGAKVIRACLRAMPKAKEELATKTVQNIRDKLRNWYL